MMGLLTDKALTGWLKYSALPIRPVTTILSSSPLKLLLVILDAVSNMSWDAIAGSCRDQVQIETLFGHCLICIG